MDRTEPLHGGLTHPQRGDGSVYVVGHGTAGGRGPVGIRLFERHPRRWNARLLHRAGRGSGCQPAIHLAEPAPDCEPARPNHRPRGTACGGGGRGLRPGADRRNRRHQAVHLERHRHAAARSGVGHRRVAERHSRGGQPGRLQPHGADTRFYGLVERHHAAPDGASGAIGALHHRTRIASGGHRAGGLRAGEFHGGGRGRQLHLERHGPSRGFDDVRGGRDRRHSRLQQPRRLPGEVHGSGHLRQYRLGRADPHRGRRAAGRFPDPELHSGGGTGAGRRGVLGKLFGCGRHAALWLVAGRNPAGGAGLQSPKRHRVRHSAGGGSLQLHHHGRRCRFSAPHGLADVRGNRAAPGVLGLARLADLQLPTGERRAAAEPVDIAARTRLQRDAWRRRRVRLAAGLSH